MHSRNKRLKTLLLSAFVLIFAVLCLTVCLRYALKPDPSAVSSAPSENAASAPGESAPVSSQPERTPVSSVASVASETVSESSAVESESEISSAPVSSAPSAVSSEPNSSTVSSHAVSSASASRPVSSAAPRKTAALVVRMTDGAVLFEERAHEKYAPASLTKLATALVALKYAAPDAVFTVGRELEFVQPNSSLALLAQGHRLTLEQLLYGLLLASGNDAAYTIAVNVGRIIQPGAQTNAEAVAAFVSEMNQYCAALGMHESHFATPDGWDDNAQYATAADLLLLARATLDNALLREIVKTESKSVVFVSGQQITWQSSNKLLRPQSGFYHADCIGIKTGTTGDAGQCLISAFDAKKAIIIVLNTDSDERRYRYTTELLQTYFP